MWIAKWLKWLWLAIIPISLVMPSMVMADNSAEITVTAVGYVCGAPGGLTLTYINDYEVGISWVKGASAENTMIRAAIGRYPEDRDDGWLVYYGNGTSTSDTGVSLDETAVPTYYRAWSENIAGGWNEYEYAEGNIEGIGVQLLAFIALAVGLTIGGYALRRMPLCFGAGGAWVVMAFYSMSKSSAPNVTEITDIYMALFWIGIAMVMVCMLEPAIQKRQKGLAEETAEALEDDEEAGVREFTQNREAMEKIRSQMRGNRPPRRKISKFNRTGIVD